jgi:putative ATP-dependent endonuclease of the OLD family
MYDQIIFVEGPSDEQIVREFARTLNVNLGQLNLGFIQMGGVRNLGHYAAAEIVTFLTKRQVRLFFLVDSDESQSIHFQRLRDEFSQNAKVHVLQKREIENYLLSPLANIKHLIIRKKAVNAHGFVAPNKEEFSALEEKAADSLKPLAIWKRVLASASRPFYPKSQGAGFPSEINEMKERATRMLQAVQTDTESLIAGVDGMCDNAELAVESVWSDKKMDVVPGSAILDEVYKTFGFRYDKMRDGIGIASQMQIAEIVFELQDFLKQLTGTAASRF